jgi:S1-C subfamily serine protease
VVVANVASGSVADRAGLMRGDVIEEVNRKPISSERQLEEALSGPKALLKVHRQGGTFFAALGD